MEAVDEQRKQTRMGAVEIRFVVRGWLLRLEWEKTSSACGVDVLGCPQRKSERVCQEWIGSCAGRVWRGQV